MPLPTEPIGSTRLAATGSPVLTDGEQGKPSFATYSLQGFDALAPNGAVIPFADGHTRQLFSIWRRRRSSTRRRSSSR